MNRIKLPTPDQIPTAALSLLDAVKKQLVMVPNLMKILSITRLISLRQTHCHALSHELFILHRRLS